MEDKKEIKIESIGTSISGILLDNIKNHEAYMTTARLGGVDLKTQEELNRNLKVKRRCSSLPRIISSQMGMIRVSLSIIKLRAEKEWKTQYPTEEDQKSHPFNSKDNNDYNKFIEILEVLNYYEKSIRESQWTNNPKDDFIKQIQHERMNFAVHDLILTENFFDMLEGLEMSFVQIYTILLRNGLITDITTELKGRSKSSGIY